MDEQLVEALVPCEAAREERARGRRREERGGERLAARVRRILV